MVQKITKAITNFTQKHAFAFQYPSTTISGLLKMFNN